MNHFPGYTYYTAVRFFLVAIPPLSLKIYIGILQICAYGNKVGFNKMDKCIYAL